MNDWRTRLDQLRDRPWAGMTRAERRQLRKLLGREKGLGWRIHGNVARGRPQGLTKLDHGQTKRTTEMDPDDE